MRIEKMKGSEAQVKFANDIIKSRKPLVVDGVAIGSDWRSGYDGRSPTEQEIIALNACVEAINAIDDAPIVIQTKNMSMAQILKRAEQVIAVVDQMGVMKKDEFVTKIPKPELMIALELIRAL